MERTYVKIGSFNVRNLVLPGVPYYNGKKYSQAAYDRKLDWLAEQLLRMDAGVVGLQEVFHAEPIAELIERYNQLAE